MTRLRWPGADGWLVLAVDLAVLALAAWRGVEGLTGPLLLGVAATALYLGFTRWLRRPPARAVHPHVDGVRVLVVIPTKDNAGTIGRVVRGCLAHTPDVLVVDDGCTDGSGALAEQAGARVVVHAENRGKGAAIETALDVAAERGFSHVLAIDADGQHEPDDLPRFFDAIRAAPEALIAGVRDMAAAPNSARGARSNSNFWVRVATGGWIGDTQCGFRAYPVAPIRALELMPSRYQWEVEVLVRAVWEGVPVLDHPCRVFYPPKGERVSSYRKVVDTLRITSVFTQLIFARVCWPPRWFPSAGRWQDGHRGFTAGWGLYLTLLRAVGRGPVRVALVPVVAFYWLFLGGQQAGVDAYLRRRVPDAGSLRRAWLRFRLLLNFAWSLVDRFDVLIRGTEHLAIDRGPVPGLQRALYGEHAGKGVILVSAHAGNAEIGASILRDQERRVHLLLYRSPGDPYLAMLQRTLGPRAPTVIAINDGLQHASLQALRALDAGDVVVAKGDRPIDARWAEVAFLGGTIRVPTGPFLLAALSGAPIVFLGCFAVEGGGYRIEASGPRVLAFRSRKTRDEDLQRWAQEWADTLAAWTERYPLQWYNFFDPWAH